MSMTSHRMKAIFAHWLLNSIILPFKLYKNDRIRFNVLLCTVTDIQDDPFIDQVLITSTTSRPHHQRPTTRATKPNRGVEHQPAISYVNQVFTTSTTSRPHHRTQPPRVTEEPIFLRPQTTEAHAIADIIENRFTPETNSICPTISSENAMITNQLKLITLHVQSTDQKTDALLVKVNALEEVISGLLTDRPNVSKKLLLKGIPYLPVLTVLTEVRAFVDKTLNLPELGSSILSATQNEDGVVLNVRSVIDKLRILYRAKSALDTAPVEVVDPDSRSFIQRRDAAKYQEQATSEERAFEGPESFDFRSLDRVRN